MNVSLDQWRISIGLFHGATSVGIFNKRYYMSFLSTINYIIILFKFIQQALFMNLNISILRDFLQNCHFALIISILLLLASDIEQNPGPPNFLSDLSVLHLNIRSIRNKMEYIIDNFLDFDILCFSETHLDTQIATESLLLSDSFDIPYRKDRTNHGGGLLVYLNSELIHHRRHDLEMFCEESVWVEIKMNNFSYLLGLFYSPRTADNSFFNNLSLNIEKAYEFSKSLVIVGDLNEDLLNPNFHNLKDLLLINSMQNSISDPTRQHAILDPIIIPEDLPFLDSGTISIPSEISDHKATFIRFPSQYECQKSFERQIWIYKNANFEQLKQMIINHDWSSLNEGSVSEAFVNFTFSFLKLVKICIPSKRITVRPNDKPWFDSEIRHYVRIRDRLKRKARNSGTSDSWNKYKHIRNKVNNLKKHAKEKFYNNLEISLSDFHNNDKKKFWHIIRHFVKSNNTSGNIPPLVIDSAGHQNVYCFTDEEKAECLNNYFTSISNVDDSNTQLPFPQIKCQNTVSSISCTPSEVETLIKLLNPNKATGPDNVSNKMLKAVAKEISLPLSLLFNRSFTEGVFADSLKESNVVPLFKKDDKSLPSSYKPISLLSNIGKLQERIAFKHIYNHFHVNQLLYKYQSGFLPNHSTTYQLIDIYHHICQTFDNDQFSCMVFCDVSKAFDRVWHKGLIFKLKQYGINGSLLNWVSDYLSNRRQRVVIRSCTSSSLLVKAGVPQGSVLGPLLFLIYVNDIADSLLSLTRLFADDSSLFYSTSSLFDLQGIINHDLVVLSAWAKQWLITFNPTKTEAILFTLKHYQQLPLIEFDGNPITFVSSHKHLGLTFTNNGRWQNHIENIVKAASKIIGIMRKLKYTFHRVALNQIYISYVLPILEYSAIVWDNCTIQNSNILEKLQNEAARLVTGLTRSVSLENLYKECGWVPLSTRRQEQKLSFMFKAVNGLTPDYIYELIPPLVSDTSQYALRNSRNINIPFTRTEISRKSCIPSSVALWNSLEDDIRSSSNLSGFKENIKKLRPNSFKVPSFYLQGDRWSSVQHARMRNNCSILNHDLFNNHLCPSPVCSCNDNAIEDAEHFFFNCPKYSDIRLNLFHATRAFHPLNIDKLLFGDVNATDSENFIIFSAVHNFIKRSLRFAQ